MSVLTENIVLSRTRAQDLNSVRKLNCWGSELTDVSLVRLMPFAEVLSLSVNSISTLLDFSFCKNLQELYIRKNNISDLNEVIYLRDLPRLKSLWLADNPCAECDHYRMTVLRTLPNLQKLDNINVTPQEVEQARSKGRTLLQPSESSENETLHLQNSPPQGGVAGVHSVERISPHEKTDISKSVDERKEILVTQHIVQRTESCSEISVPKQPKSNNFKVEIFADEPREQLVHHQHQHHSPPSPPTRSSSSSSSEVPLRHTTSSSNIAGEHHQHQQQQGGGGVAAASGSIPTGAHHNHAFYARVQTLVDHSSRRPPRKPSDLQCESRSNKSNTSSPPPSSSHHPPTGGSSSLSNNNNMENSPEHFQGNDIESHYYGGPGGDGSGARDFPEIETRSASLDSEASYYADQRSALGGGGGSTGGNSRSDKNSPNRVLPKGGRNRNSNILSAVLCLIKELDYASLEVVETAIHCQMEDMDN